MARLGICRESPCQALYRAIGPSRTDQTPVNQYRPHGHRRQMLCVFFARYRAARETYFRETLFFFRNSFARSRITGSAGAALPSLIAFELARDSSATVHTIMPTE